MDVDMNLQDRDAGIDAVKTIAIFLVVFHHLLDFGFTLSASAPGGLRLGWYFFRGVAISCNNLFAIATGYLCVTSAHVPRHIPALWCQTVFTGAAVALGCRLAGVAVAPFDWFRAVFPVVTGEYWYFSAYVVVALLAPLLNPGLRSLPKAAFARILAALFLLVSVPSVLFSSDPFVVKHGYSFSWLLVLYVFGAFWRLHLTVPPRRRACWAVLAGASLVFLVPSVGKRLFSGAIGDWFSGFNPIHPSSPSTLAISLAIFGLCRHVHVQSPGPRRVLAFVAGLAFGMYLWLVNPVFWRAFWRPWLSSVVIGSPAGFVAAFGLAMAVSLAAACILEQIRRFLFRAVLRLRRPAAS